MSSSGTALALAVVGFGCAERSEEIVKDGATFVAFEPGVLVSEGFGGGVGTSEALSTSATSSEVTEAIDRIDVGSMSLGELAEKLRAVTPGPGGRPYIAKEPNWEAAKALKSSPLGVPLRVEGEHPPDLSGLRGSYIFGSDDRTVPANTAPWNQIVYLEAPSTEPGKVHRCSGVFVGWRTIITAAHCLYDRSKTKPWLGPFRYVPGKRGPLEPYDDFPLGVNHYLPAAYASGDDNYDFAVVNVANNSPTGWNGYWINYGGGAAKSYGYPGTQYCPGKTTYGWLCGTSGVADLRGSAIFDTDDMDLTKGMSGGPWLTSTNYTIGVTSEQRKYRDLSCNLFDYCYRNTARRLDDTMWNFIKAYSTEL